MKSFDDYLDAQREFDENTRFCLPSLTEENEENPKFKEKYLRLLVTSIYFNILKNEQLLNLQKEEISILKEAFDIEKKYGTFKEIQEANQAYTESQIEYLAYKKAIQLSQKQLKIFTGQETEITSVLDDFDTKKALKELETNQKQLTKEQDDIFEHFKYEAQKYQNLTERINKQSQLAQTKDYLTELNAKYDIIEMRKNLAATKLRCVVYYFSLKEALI